MKKKNKKLSKIDQIKIFLKSVLAPIGIFILAQLLAYLIVLPFVSSFSEVELTITQAFMYASLYEVIVLTLVWWVLKLRKKNLNWLGLGEWPKLKNMVLVLPAAGVYITAAVASFLLIEALNIGVDLNQEQNVGFESASGGMEIIMTFIALVVLTPLVEEILMRGMMFRNLNRTFGFYVAAITSAAIFGILHGQWNVFIDTLILGLILAWLVNKTNSLWPAIALHSLKNLIAFMYLFVF